MGFLPLALFPEKANHKQKENIGVMSWAQSENAPMAALRWGTSVPYWDRSHCGHGQDFGVAVTKVTPKEAAAGGSVLVTCAVPTARSCPQIKQHNAPKSNNNNCALKGLGAFQFSLL